MVYFNMQSIKSLYAIRKKINISKSGEQQYTPQMSLVFMSSSNM